MQFYEDAPVRITGQDMRCAGPAGNRFHWAREEETRNCMLMAITNCRDILKYMSLTR